MTASTGPRHVAGDGTSPADPAVAERLHRLFGYLRAVRAVFDRPVRDLTVGGPAGGDELF